MRIHGFVAAAALMAGPTAVMAAPILLVGDGADTTTFGTKTVDPSDGSAGSGLAATGGITMKVGSVRNDADQTLGGRAAVYVFQLPDLGAVANPFASAQLSFFVGAIDANTATTTLVNGDLYGLGRRATSTVATTDYYLGSADDTTDATKIQDSILAAGVTPAQSLVTTDLAGSDALAAYLNTQYAGGAGVGEYVFLRLSPDKAMSVVTPLAQNNTGYNVYTANELTNPKPTITYEVIPEPSSLALLGLGGLALARRRRA